MANASGNTSIWHYSFPWNFQEWLGRKRLSLFAVGQHNGIWRRRWDFCECYVWRICTLWIYMGQANMYQRPVILSLLHSPVAVLMLGHHGFYVPFTCRKGMTAQKKQERCWEVGGRCFTGRLQVLTFCIYMCAHVLYIAVSVTLACIYALARQSVVASWTHEESDLGEEGGEDGRCICTRGAWVHEVVPRGVVPPLEQLPKITLVSRLHYASRVLDRRAIYVFLSPPLPLGSRTFLVNEKR